MQSYISSHLSHYIKNYPKELGEVPIQNLYNIFNNGQNDLQSHDDLFSFIINQVKQTNDDKYYILIHRFLHDFSCHFARLGKRR